MFFFSVGIKVVGEYVTIAVLAVVQAFIAGIFGVIMWRLNKPMQAAEIKGTEASALREESEAFASLVKTLSETTKEFTELIRVAVKGRQDLEDEVKLIKEDNQNLRLKVAELLSLHADEMEALETRYKAQMATLEEKLNVQHKKELAALEAKLTEQHQKELETIRKNHATQIEELKRQHKQEMETLRMQWNQDKQRINDLEEKLSTLQKSSNGASTGSASDGDHPQPEEVKSEGTAESGPGTA